MSELTRRRFCVVTGAGLVTGACGSSAQPGASDLAVPSDLTSAPRDLVDPSCPVNHMLNVGPASAIVVGQPRFFQCARLFVLRDAMGIYAMTAVCTHEACTIDFVAAAHDFECPCHQSRFDLDGAVTAMPATIPLGHYGCSLDGSGNLVIDLSQAVPAQTRLAVHD